MVEVVLTAVSSMRFAANEDGRHCSIPLFVKWQCEGNTTVSISGKLSSYRRCDCCYAV